MQLSEPTTKQHISRIRRFLNHIGKEPQDVTYADIQSFLAELQTNPSNIINRDVERISPSTYANWVKSFKRYFRDFLHKEELVRSFKLPEMVFQFTKISSKDELQKAYSVLKKKVEKAIFLMYATSSLRRNTLLNLRIADVDFSMRCIMPSINGSRTKRTNFTFYNDETQLALEDYLATKKDLNPESKLFDYTGAKLKTMFKRIERKTGIHLSPQSLRKWFCSELASKNISDSYIDFFAGRTPKSVLAKHYLDYSPEKLKQIYDGARLKVLS